MAPAHRWQSNLNSVWYSLLMDYKSDFWNLWIEMELVRWVSEQFAHCENIRLFACYAGCGPSYLVHSCSQSNQLNGKHNERVHTIENKMRENFENLIIIHFFANILFMKFASWNCLANDYFPCWTSIYSYTIHIHKQASSASFFAFYCLSKCRNDQLSFSIMLHCIMYTDPLYTMAYILKSRNCIFMSQHHNCVCVRFVRKKC